MSLAALEDIYLVSASQTHASLKESTTADPTSLARWRKALGLLVTRFVVSIIHEATSVVI